MSVEEVKANYNEIGLKIIERMYSQDYLSIGGMQSTEVLADKAGITKHSRVLDIGSGLGGPALHLAKAYGCRVTGLDVVDINIREASARAGARGLDHLADFKLGDATALPFSANTFNVIWGQDAWCHVTDKDQMLKECARVMKPNGTIAFTDWVLIGTMAPDYHAELLAAAASPNMGTTEAYRELLAKHGFVAQQDDDISLTFIDQYRDIIARLETMEAALSEEFSEKVYRIVRSKNRRILNAFEQHKMGGRRFIATMSQD